MKGTITKETEKYIYTTEVVNYTTDRYFIDFTGNGRKVMGCTVYQTKEEAEANIKREAMLWGYKPEQATIRWQYYAGTKVLHHRYKKG